MDCTEKLLVKLCLTKELLEAVEKRHDIVHRNGKTKDDIEFEISKEEVLNLKDNVSIFIKNIENSFDNLLTIF